MTSFVSIGDMALHFHMRQQNTQLKADIQRFAKEMTAGLTTDVSKTVKGDFLPLSEIERSLTVLSSFERANTEAALYASTMQTSLETLQDITHTVGPILLQASNARQPSLIETAAGDAKQKFIATVSTLNTQIAGRNLFSGAATDSKSLASAESILTALQTAIAGKTTTAEVWTAVNTWFDAPGGGFESSAYIGSDIGVSSFQIGTNDQAALDIKANHSAFRETLKGLAVAALVSEGALSGDPDEQFSLIESAGEHLLGAEGGLVALRAHVGFVEAQIENASAQNVAEKSAMEVAWNSLIGVDEFDAAARLQAAQSQLETLYTLTARISRLTLADYLR